MSDLKKKKSWDTVKHEKEQIAVFLKCYDVSLSSVVISTQLCVSHSAEPSSSSLFVSPFEHAPLMPNHDTVTC